MVNQNSIKAPDHRKATIFNIIGIVLFVIRLLILNNLFSLGGDSAAGLTQILGLLIFIIPLYFLDIGMFDTSLDHTKKIKNRTPAQERNYILSNIGINACVITFISFIIGAYIIPTGPFSIPSLLISAFIVLLFHCVKQSIKDFRENKNK